MFYRLIILPYQKRAHSRVSGTSYFHQTARWFLQLRITLNKTFNAIGTQVLALFVGLSASAFSLFVCDPVPGGSVEMKTVRRYPEIVCFDKEWQKALGFGIGALVIYTFGVLTSVLYISAIAPRQFHHVVFRTRFFFIFDDFKPTTFWWRVVILFKALALNIALVVLVEYPEFLMVSILLLFMSSTALLFFVRPWNDPILNVIDIACHMSFNVLLACWAFHLKDHSDRGSDVSLGIIQMVDISMLLMPVLVTALCACYPLYKYFFRLQRQTRNYRLSQEFRDVVELLCRRSNTELNAFFAKLYHTEREQLGRTIDTVHAKMFQLQPRSRLRRLLIDDASCFLSATDERVLGLLVDGFREGRVDANSSLRERALVQWFVKALTAGYHARFGVDPSLPELFNLLDGDKDGIITEDEFVEISTQTAPLLIELTRRVMSSSL